MAGENVIDSAVGGRKLELVAIQWKPSASGKVQIESKDDLNGRLGRSPDRADAVSMVFYSGSVRGRGLRNLTPLRGKA